MSRGFRHTHLPTPALEIWGNPRGAPLDGWRPLLRRTPIDLQGRPLRAYGRGIFAVRLRTLLDSPAGNASYAQFLTLLRNPSAAESGGIDYKGEQYGNRTERGR
ncbi:hypothetical protein OOK06_22540 [Streptomyces sp. NBC_00340]|uniref:hypothetical protein n=1 Tax=unclassified Streptomyces TaxID=2593676 RepID=UPI0013BA565C|nr:MULTISPECIES: hypothetical protein [unclassified Streptomyces]MCX5134854.1 hypothetical protein [Streptomyces sp. NBC_00340]NEB27753.1 hypothetical protein [Streptomyces sp. SID14446]